MASNCLRTNINSSPDLGTLLRPRVNPGEPESLPELGVARGVLGEVKPFVPGLVLAAIGRRKIVLPAELDLAGLAGKSIEVLKQDEYSVVAI